MSRIGNLMIIDITDETKNNSANYSGYRQHAYKFFSSHIVMSSLLIT